MPTKQKVSLFGSPYKVGGEVEIFGPPLYNNNSVVRGLKIQFSDELRNIPVGYGYDGTGGIFIYEDEIQSKTIETETNVFHQRTFLLWPSILGSF